LLYDEDLNGFITVSELTKIVMANHLAADTAAVERKVATIMRQCDDDRSGHLNREEFKVCAEKFPNLLFPTFSS
jgi:Ca2+-binding EF-hand superfamily protein